MRLCLSHSEVKRYLLIFSYLFFRMRKLGCAVPLQSFVSLWTQTKSGRGHCRVYLKIVGGLPVSIYLLLIYLLTPWRRIILEQLTGLQLVKKFPAFHGTRRFITALTTVHQLSLSWASPIQSIYPHPTSWRSKLILYTYLRLGLPSSLLPSGLHMQPQYR